MVAVSEKGRVKGGDNNNIIYASSSSFFPKFHLQIEAVNPSLEEHQPVPLRLRPFAGNVVLRDDVPASAAPVPTTARLVVTGFAAFDDDSDDISGLGGAITTMTASGQSMSMSGSVGSPSSRSEQTMATPANDNTFRLNHLDIHAYDAVSQGRTRCKTGLRLPRPDLPQRLLRLNLRPPARLPLGILMEMIVMLRRNG
ncbi:hypothetical protein L484_014611 [Morus notabilis]|uniref:Uncharacterized protein n=1 Tax=Morus notabilis TaxID=981085 RepID=W9QYT1_9ROSA|nr:uncharacterized protein LOC21397744 [Morus notabilis]EXB59116.1 hypothetical protein L484_014611 [Morus notabilis]